MVDLIEDNMAGETHLLRLMEERYHLRPDVPLLNALIKRRAARGAFNDAVRCLEIMTKLRLNPDEKTFGCLALGCRTTRDGKELVRSMMVAGMKPNMPVLGAMITNAIGRFNFDLAGFVVLHIVKHRMPVGQKFITCVHAAMTSCSHTLKEKVIGSFDPFPLIMWRFLETIVTCSFCNKLPRFPLVALGNSTGNQVGADGR
jgi:pentatricopeptide repeat domain-containing protein 1